MTDAALLSTKPSLEPKAAEAAEAEAVTGLAVATATTELMPDQPGGRDLRLVVHEQNLPASLVSDGSSAVPLAAREDSPSWLWPRAAYVHVPFCAHKCGYCDFASLAGFDHLADRYLAALERELAMTLGQPAPVDTVFVGGGTPTRLAPLQLERLMAMVADWFPLTTGGEWTVEANPGTLDDAKVAVLAAAGVNRISLGAQSFRPALLATLERNHAAQEVERAVELVRTRFRAGRSI